MAPDDTPAAPPPEPGDDLGSRPASRDFVTVRISEVRLEIADLRTEMRTEFANVRTEIADLRTELKTEMAQGFASLHGAMTSQTHKLMAWTIGIVTLVVVGSGVSSRFFG